MLVTFIVEGSRKRVFSQLYKRTQVSFGRLCVLSVSITLFLALEIKNYLICFGSFLLMAECCVSGKVVLSLFVIYVVVGKSWWNKGATDEHVCIYCFHTCIHQVYKQKQS